MAVSSIHIELDKFFHETRGLNKDNCWEWFESFRNTLLYKGYEENPHPYALALLDETECYSAYCAVCNIEGRVIAELERKKETFDFEKVYKICMEKKGSDYARLKEKESRYLELHPEANRWRDNNRTPQDAPNGNAGVDMSDAGNGDASKSPTSCDTLTADGDTREDSQAKPDGSAITRNETRAHDALEPSANHYGDTREHSRGRYAPPSCSPDDGNPAETAPSHGGSVASLEARQGQALESQRRAGADSVRGTPLHSAPARSPARKFRNKEEYMQWAIDTGLDPDDAGNCWEATMERGGLTKDGKKVENICAYAVKWCRTAKEKRSKSA